MVYVLLLMMLLFTAPAYADTCTARTDVPNYSNNTQVPQICDGHGSQRVTIMGPNGSTSGVSLVTPNGDSVMDETNDAVSVILDTLISGEDQTNNLLMTSGGAARSTTLVNALALSGTQTSAVTTLPVGPKTIQGILTCNAGGSTNCGVTMTFYGGPLNSTTAGQAEQLCQVIIPTGAAYTSGTCPVITGAFLYYYVTTSSPAGTSPTITITATY